MRLKRAQHHIRDLKREIDVFMADEPWTKIVEVDAEGVFKEHKLRFTREFPDDLCLITADALHNLRSALDQCGCAAAQASGVCAPESSAFPFGKTADGVLNCAKGRSKDIPPDIVALMCAFKPYETGNPILYALNTIRNVNDHALLKPVGACVPSVSIMARTQAANVPFLIPSGARWFPDKNEIVFALSKANEPDAEYKFEIHVAVAFGEVGVIAGHPAFGVLGNMTRMVDEIIKDIETATRRLFPNAFT